MIEVQGTNNGHTLFGGEDHRGRKPSNRPCDRDHNGLIQAVDDLISREDQNGAALVRMAKRLPADFAPVYGMFSQP